MSTRFPLTRSLTLALAASVSILPLIACDTTTIDPDDSAGSLPQIAPEETEESFGLCASDGGVLGSVATVDNRHGEVLAADVAASGMVGIASEDQSLKFWDSRTGEQTGAVDNFAYFPAFEVGSDLTAIAMTPDGQTAISSETTGRVAAWDVSSSELLADFPGTGDGIQVAALASDPDGETIAVANQVFGGNVTLRDLSSGAVTPLGETPLWQVSGLDFDPSGTAIALIGDIYAVPALAIRNLSAPEAALDVWEGGSLFYEHQRGSARTASWTPDGQKLVVIGDRFAAILDAEDVSADPAPVQVLFDDHDPIDVVVSSDGSWFATIGTEGQLRILSTTDGEELITEQLHQPQTLGLAPDGSRLTVVHDDGLLELLGCVAQ